PKGTYAELSPRQAARVHPAAASAPAEIRRLVTTYVGGRGKDAVLVTVSAVGESALLDPDFQAGFRDGQEAGGATSSEIEIGGLEALEFRSPGTSETSITARIGCHQVSVLARGSGAARAELETLLASR
ncbi:MAG: hypothetical protein M3Y34_05385, partial [Actinomycetota bacterium]|nr:hypothetical protein [Actinomycetota bacterium]